MLKGISVHTHTQTHTQINTDKVVILFIIFLFVDEQMVNHIPNCNLLTNKLGLLNTLQEYDRVYGSIKKRVPKLDFIPETYKLDDSKEREIFRDKWKGK